MEKIFFTVVAAAIVGLSACRKKEGSAMPSLSSAPDKASYSAGVSSNPSAIEPEAEATASTGPIQLTFRLYKKTVKAQASEFDTTLWGQIELKNVGKNKFLIQDDVFYEPGLIKDVTESYLSRTYVEIVDSQGKRIGVYRPWRDEIVDDNSPAPSPTLAQVQKSKKANEMIARWRQQGLSSMEIRDRFSEYQRSQSSRDETESLLLRYADSHSELLPGQSTMTMASAHAHAGLQDVPLGKATGQFTALNSYALKPGNYRIHAIYDHTRSERMKRMEKTFPPHETDVRVETPYISFEVVR